MKAAPASQTASIAPQSSGESATPIVSALNLIGPVTIGAVALTGLLLLALTFLRLRARDEFALNAKRDIGTMSLGGRNLVLAHPRPIAAGLSANSEGGLKCRIESRSAGGMTELKGVVVAGRGVKGRYQFTISSSGAGGSSDVRQAGDFSTEAGKKAEVGFASLSIDGHYKAALSVVVDGKTYQCREDFRGAL